MSTQEILAEIDQLNGKLKKHPKNMAYLCRLASLHLDDNKLSRCKPLLTKAIEIYKETKGPTLKQGIELLEVMTKQWKADKYSGKIELMRINLLSEREQLLTQIHEVAKGVLIKKDPESGHLLALKMAYIKECKGDFQGALAILSDLIAAQAMDNVDLSYIIFKAAILLKHIGQPKQSIEYLEFILEDPPIQDGFTKSHICAFLIHVYEQSGEKYKVFLPKTYKDLQHSIIEDMPAAASKIMRATQARGGLSHGSELWELLAVQALERCEYVLAGEFLSEAISKSPGKVKPMLMLAEVYALLKQREQAQSLAEEAFAANPQSAELRNLLLQVAPDIWTEKLRGLSTTTTGTSGNAKGSAGSRVKHEDEDDSEIASAYAPPSHATVSQQQTSNTAQADRFHKGALQVDSGLGSPAMSSTLGSPFGAGNLASPPSATDANRNRHGAEESSSWLSKMKSKANDALKAVSASTPQQQQTVASTLKRATSPNTAPVAASLDAPAAMANSKDKQETPVKEGSIQRWIRSSSPLRTSVASPSAEASTGAPDEDRPLSRPKSRGSFISLFQPSSPAAEVNAEGTDEERPQSRPKSRSSFISLFKPAATDIDAEGTNEERPNSRSKSRGNFMSMFKPSAGADPSAEGTEEERPLSRPKSRGSFISMLLPSGAAGSERGDRVSSPPKSTASSKGSPLKAGATTGSSKKTTPIKPAGSPPKAVTAAVSPAPSAARSPQKPRTRSVAAPKVKKPTKYDVSQFSSRLPAERSGSDASTKPERPVLTRDDRKLLDLILNGNENVPVYDPNLLVLKQMRQNAFKKNLEE